MHIPASDEQLIPLREAVKLPWMPRKKGKALHIATLYRWAQAGIGGRRLAVWRVGGAWCTTEGALRAFIERDAAPATPQGVPQSTSQRRRTAADAATEAAKIFGIRDGEEA